MNIFCKLSTYVYILVPKRDYYRHYSHEHCHSDGSLFYTNDNIHGNFHDICQYENTGLNTAVEFSRLVMIGICPFLQKGFLDPTRRLVGLAMGWLLLAIYSSIIGFREHIL